MRTRTRILAGTTIALLVAGTAYICAWHELHRSFSPYTSSHPGQKMPTRRDLDGFEKLVIQYRTSHEGKLPKSLAEFSEPDLFFADMRSGLNESAALSARYGGSKGRVEGSLGLVHDWWDSAAAANGAYASNHQPRDHWGNPYQYRPEGDGFVLYSLGRDGQPGGTGIDADVYPSSSGRPLPVATLLQFTFELQTRGVWQACGLAGLCAGLVCVVGKAGEKSRTRFLARAVVTFAAAVVTAQFMSALHVPSGH